MLTYPWFHKLNNTLILQIYREFKIISKVLKLKLDFVLESVILNISIIHVSNPLFLSKQIHSIKQNWALRTSMVACLYDLSFPLYKLWWYIPTRMPNTSTNYCLSHRTKNLRQYSLYSSTKGLLSQLHGHTSSEMKIVASYKKSEDHCNVKILSA